MLPNCLTTTLHIHMHVHLRSVICSWQHCNASLCLAYNLWNISYLAFILTEVSDLGSFFFFRLARALASATEPANSMPAMVTGPGETGVVGSSAGGGGVGDRAATGSSFFSYKNKTIIKGETDECHCHVAMAIGTVCCCIRPRACRLMGTGPKFKSQPYDL